MTELNATVTDDKRYELMKQAQKMIAKDCVNGFLFQWAKHGVWKKDIVGLWKNSPIQATDLTEVYWEK